MGGFLIKDACSGEKRGAADMVSEQATMRNIDCTEMREMRSVLICRPPCSSPGNLCGCRTKAHAEQIVIPTFRNLSQRPRHLISQGVWCLIRPSSWSLLVQGCHRWHFEFCGTTRCITK